MDKRPSPFAPKAVMQYSRIAVVCSGAALLAGCVSQPEVLNVNAALQQPSPQLGLTTDGTSEAGGAFASNIPVRAPRPNSNVQVATTQSSKKTNQSDAVLAVVDPQKPAVPAQTVIETAASGTPSTESQAPEAAQIVASTETGSTNSESVESAPAEQKVAALSPDPTPQPVATQQKPKVTGLLARLFQNTNTSTEKRVRKSRTQPTFVGRDDDERGGRIASAHATATKKRITPRKTVALTRRDASNNALPGVKSNSQLFGVTEDEGAVAGGARVTQVAAVGSLGRLSPNGVRVQHEKVQVACLKPGVLRLLKIVERKYGRKPIVTSGYRSPKRNRRAGGAKNSMHIYCKAADIQVEGVSKWQLAKFLRTVPGRGGVGTYCRTKSVHIDTGSVRDWHHPCRRSSKRKKRRT
ncbi:MAG: D-Ala-D-Ala carboxypeptidase family metallohydrolase [Rhizobiaceae bacterium]|nr:D-Ala-D-Ala carboxypeptidase family metallohydrolase [Rhizobiaceae bacterium]